VLAPAYVASVTGDARVFLSPVTLAELKFGAEIAKDPDVQQKTAGTAEMKVDVFCAESGFESEKV
jgi:predicted nucleic acid-binding protein